MAILIGADFYSFSCLFYNFFLDMQGCKDQQNHKHLVDKAVTSKKQTLKEKHISW